MTSSPTRKTLTLERVKRNSPSAPGPDDLLAHAVVPEDAAPIYRWSMPFEVVADVVVHGCENGKAQRRYSTLVRDDGAVLGPMLAVFPADALQPERSALCRVRGTLRMRSNGYAAPLVTLHVIEWEYVFGVPGDLAKDA